MIVVGREFVREIYAGILRMIALSFCFHRVNFLDAAEKDAAIDILLYLCRVSSTYFRFCLRKAII